MNRDELRAAFANKCKTRRRPHTLTMDDGTTIEVTLRGMTVGQRKKMLDASSVIKKDDDGNAVPTQDPTTASVITTMMCTLVPETDVPVFDERDRDILDALPFGVLDELSNVVMELSGATKTAREDAIKNSAATPAADSPSR